MNCLINYEWQIVWAEAAQQFSSVSETSNQFSSAWILTLMLSKSEVEFSYLATLSMNEDIILYKIYTLLLTLSTVSAPIGSISDRGSGWLGSNFSKNVYTKYKMHRWRLIGQKQYCLYVGNLYTINIYAYIMYRGFFPFIFLYQLQRVFMVFIHFLQLTVNLPNTQSNTSSQQVRHLPLLCATQRRTQLGTQKWIVLPRAVSNNMREPGRKPQKLQIRCIHPWKATYFVHKRKYKCSMNLHNNNHSSYFTLRVLYKSNICNTCIFPNLISIMAEHAYLSHCTTRLVAARLDLLLLVRTN